MTCDTWQTHVLQRISNWFSFVSPPSRSVAWVQRQKLNLPFYPTTTIGSFPQTPQIRKARRQHPFSQVQLQLFNKGLKLPPSPSSPRKGKLGVVRPLQPIILLSQFQSSVSVPRMVVHLGEAEKFQEARLFLGCHRMLF